jgi:hypothetical protein
MNLLAKIVKKSHAMTFSQMQVLMNDLQLGYSMWLPVASICFPDIGWLSKCGAAFGRKCRHMDRHRTRTRLNFKTGLNCESFRVTMSLQSITSIPNASFVGIELFGYM